MATAAVDTGVPKAKVRAMNGAVTTEDDRDDDDDEFARARAR